jgi:RNA polymerase sigma factor (sigma-70 family)
VGADVDDATRRRRWELVLPHRPSLVRLALRRGLSPYDAEDCAQEALLRCVGFAGLDESRVTEFLVTTTVRLCADQHRLRTRDLKVSRKIVNTTVDEPSPEEQACSRGEAVWVAGHVATLPEPQRAALAARADGLSGSDIAARMGLSYKAVESLLSRARATVRAAATSAYVLLFAATRRASRVPGGAGALSVVAFVTAAALVSPPAAPPPAVAALPRTERAVAVPSPAAPPGAVSSAAPGTVRPSAAPPLPAPVPHPTPDPPHGPPRPGPIPPVVKEPGCRVHPPLVDTCVPVESYQPGENLANCLRNGIDLGNGVECPDSSPTSERNVP